MSKILFLIFLYSCSQVSTRKPDTEELVSLETALDHIMASYLRGCVDSYKDLQLPISFENCRDKAKLHRTEIREMMDQTPLLPYNN